MSDLRIGVGVDAHAFEAAQPALLYLCPLTLGSVALVAATRGDLGKIWAFTDTTLVTSPPGSSKEKKKEQERQAAAAADAAAEKERGQ